MQISGSSKGRDGGTASVIINGGGGSNKKNQEQETVVRSAQGGNEIRYPALLLLNSFPRWSENTIWRDFPRADLKPPPTQKRRKDDSRPF